MKTINKELLTLIFLDIKNNPKITENFLADKYLVSERTIRRYINNLKRKGLIRLNNYGRKKTWQVVSK